MTPAEALEWALADAPGAGESLARAEVARLRAIEVKFAACVELVSDLNHNHDDRCCASLCLCDHDARAALRKLVES